MGSLLSHESRINRYDESLENVFKSQVSISRGRGRSRGRGKSNRNSGPRDGNEESDQEGRIVQNPISSKIRGMTNLK